MHVVVCGDSYCSAELSGARDHFSQILQDVYGHDVTNLARGGMSTVGICFQIREALALNPDVVIYNTTTPDRVNLVQREGFDLREGLKNFAYPFKADASTASVLTGDKSAPIFATVWQELQHMVTPDQYRAIELYLLHLFDWNLQSEIDRWLIDYWHQQVLARGIQVIPFTQPEFGFVYGFAMANPSINRVFHTDRSIQLKAAEILHKKLCAS